MIGEEFFYSAMKKINKLNFKRCHGIDVNLCCMAGLKEVSLVMGALVVFELAKIVNRIEVVQHSSSLALAILPMVEDLDRNYIAPIMPKANRA